MKKSPADSVALVPVVSKEEEFQIMRADGMEKLEALVPVLQEPERSAVLGTLKGLLSGLTLRKALSNIQLRYTDYLPIIRKYSLMTFHQRALDLAKEYRLIKAEDELFRRGVEGYKEEVYTPSGKFAGYRTRYSDPLLTTVLKSMDPDKYAERTKVEHTGAILHVSLGINHAEEPSAVEQAKVVEAEASVVSVTPATPVEPSASTPSEQPSPEDQKPSSRTPDPSTESSPPTEPLAVAVQPLPQAESDRSVPGPAEPPSAVPDSPDHRIPTERSTEPVPPSA